jgi:hypothetical protein
MKFKRKKIVRYDMVETGLPSSNLPQLKNYPSFSPEMGSFNPDKFHRSGSTYSDKHFQILTKFSEAESYSIDEYRTAIIRGVDYFKKKTSIPAEWVSRDANRAAYESKVKGTFRAYRDTFAARRTPPQDWDQLTNIYGPIKLFNLAEKFLRYLYLVISREQLHYALFTYYYFYYYFYFNEYILENVFLYFPVIRVFFSNQIFSTFEGVYYSFFEISIGFFLPFFIFFIFSQYQLIVSYAGHKVYFLAGMGLFVCTFILPYVYYFTGFSNLFIFTFFFIFFPLYSVFYIFEYSGFIYPSSHNFDSYSNFFLPFYTENSVKTLFLPIYYYKYPFISFSSSFSTKKGNFTKFPFTQNVSFLVLHYKRISYYRQAERLVFKNKPFRLSAPSISISGLVFPGYENNFAYSIQSHRESVQTYPQKHFSPFNESQDFDFFAETERDYFPIFFRDHINHPDGYSQISFIEFVSRFKSTRSFDNNLNLTREEEFDFYNSAPSKKALEFLYPYYALRIWINTVKPSSNPPLYSDFEFQNIIFSNADFKPVPNISPFLVKFIKIYFSFFVKILDKITFFRYKNFSTATDTVNFLSTLDQVIKILNDNKRISPYFYISLYKYLFRSMVKLNRSFGFRDKLPLRSIFTYTIILVRIEEVLLTVFNRIEYLEFSDKSRRYGSFLIASLKKKIF